MFVKHQQDFFTGLIFTAIGIGFAIGARTYAMGTAARMGPGYFPFMLGIILALIGVVLTLKAVVGREQAEGRIGAWSLKPLFFIIAANLLFGVLLGGLPMLGLAPMGLLVATFGLTVVACRAGTEFIWKEVLLLGVLLAAACYILFVWLLNLPFQVWPAFLVA